MPVDKQQTAMQDKIEERIIELSGMLTIKLSKVESYADLSETEKIPFRVMQAEIRALKEYSVGEDLDYWLKRCIDEEQYCASEGIKRVKQFIKQIS